MIRKLEINNFKCFKKFSINNLNRINIIIGKNNVGKTNFLEAIILALSNNDFLTSIKLIARNEFLTNDKIETFFFNKKVEIKINIDLDKKNLNFSLINLENKDLFSIINKLNTNNNVNLASIINYPNLQYLLNWKFKNKKQIILADKKGNTINLFNNIEESLTKVFYYSSLEKINIEILTNFFGKIIADNKKEKFIDLFKKFFNEVENVEIASANTTKPIICIKLVNNPEYYPIFYFGEGFIKIFSIICSILFMEKAIFLIDEIDNGIHYSIQPIFWQILCNLVNEFNIQIFATTHSLEFLKNSLNMKQNLWKYIRFTRLEKYDSKIEPININLKEFSEMIEYGFEIR